MRLNLEGGGLFGSGRGNRPTPGSGTATSARSTQRLIFLRQMENKLPFKHMKREGNDESEGRAGQAEVGSTYSL